MALIFESKVPITYRAPFIAKVRQVSDYLGISPNWLMAVMELETAGTFNPAITNSIGATGLIQFMPSTAIGLGTSTASLRNMSAVDQLDYVQKYYKPYRGRINRYVDLYLATLFPIALNKASDWVLQAKNLSAEAVGRSNPLFDLNKDGRITVGEIETKLLNRLPIEWRAILMSSKKKNSPVTHSCPYCGGNIVVRNEN